MLEGCTTSSFLFFLTKQCPSDVWLPWLQPHLDSPLSFILSQAPQYVVDGSSACQNERSVESFATMILIQVGM